MFSKSEIQVFFEFAEKVVMVAGQKALEKEKKFTIAVQKERMDVATSADLEIEQFITEQVKQTFAGHTTFGEEFGGEINPETPTWVIDPIDGSKEYMRNVPLYCSVLSLEFQNQTIVAAIYNPKTDDLFSAGQGLGAFHNHQPVSVGKTDRLEKSLFFAKLPNYAQKDRLDEIYSFLKDLTLRSYRVCGHTNQNLALCSVGIGGYDGYINVVNSGHWWDYSAGIFFLKEAGGMTVTLNGDEFTYADHGELYLSTNRFLLPKLLELTKEFDLNL